MEPGQKLLIAVHTNDLESVNSALLHGADVNASYRHGYTLLHTAVESGFNEMVEILVSNDNVLIDAMTDFGMTALSLAIIAAQNTIVTLLLNAGANPNRRIVFQQSPIHLAAFHENAYILYQLIRNGAKVNTVDCFNQSPLCISILLKPSRKVTKILLEAGADPNFKSKAKLCLLAEAILSVNIFKHVAVIKTLIDYGANVNEKDEIENETPLHKAAAVGCTPIVVYLIENGAEYLSKNVHGQTPYDIAKAHSHNSICDTLDALEDAKNEREFNELINATTIIE